jgi:nifR3 family TIM-barrel protein
MVKGFWKKIMKTKGFSNKTPLFCLAPMADVTDEPFRLMIAKYGKPDVMWTEFVSADGLASKEGKKNLIKNLEYSKKEKPIIAQIFGSRPENIEKACKIIAKLGFDGIDINMGCPDKKVEKQGAGASLIKNPKLAREILKSAKRGAGKLPISVKTRIGYNKIDYKEWLKEILSEDISALTIHLRTRKEMSKVSAHWEIAKEISEYVRTLDKEVVLIANGDIKSKKEGEEMALCTGFDGVMIGRGFFGKPWLLKESGEAPVAHKLKVLVEHTKLFEKIMGNSNPEKRHKNFAVMKKHFKAYVNDFPKAKELRIKLMETDNFLEVKKIVDSWVE